MSAHASIPALSPQHCLPTEPSQNYGKHAHTASCVAGSGLSSPGDIFVYLMCITHVFSSQLQASPPSGLVMMCIRWCQEVHTCQRESPYFQTPFSHCAPDWSFPPRLLCCLWDLCRATWQPRGRVECLQKSLPAPALRSAQLAALKWMEQVLSRRKTLPNFINFIDFWLSPPCRL